MIPAEGAVVSTMEAAHDDPPYNFIIESAGKAALGAPHVHWQLRIVPDLVTAGGFEIGTGMAQLE